MLLLIASYPKANDMVARHHPFWTAAGFTDITGVSTKGGGCVFPEGMNSVEIGKDCYIDGDVLPRRLLDMMTWMLTQPHDWFTIIEPDTIFVRPLPYLLPGPTMMLTGTFLWNDQVTNFYHNPWIMDRESAIRLVEAGTRILDESKTAHESPDVFMGQMLDRANLTPNPFKLYTQNHIHTPEWVKEARQHIADGCVAVHGIKDAQHLHAIIT